MSQIRGEKHIELGKYIRVRLKRRNKVAEMIADPDRAWKAMKLIKEEGKKRSLDQASSKKLSIEDLKKIPGVNPNDIFVAFTIFEDAKKGEIYSETILEEMFETTDEMEIAYQFILDKDTEWNWTKKQREQYLESKKKQIINIITMNGVNPQTKRPHPPQRIEKAIKEANYNIDMNKTAEEQIKDVIKVISAIIPIRLENVELAVKIPVSFAAKAYSVVEKFGQIKQSEWQNDGSWVGILNLPAGLEMEFMDNINKLTHGRAEIKILKRN
ncbi:MAG: ribosome assembly factor SBDS [Promethearchaeota archaeon]